MENQEIEVKFFVQDIGPIKRRLKNCGAKLTHRRVLEQNYRFDTPDKSLAKSYRVLRLRRDKDNRLTYKGPAEMREGVQVRQEIELTVDDFEVARQFLEALGFQITMMYEKYRASYETRETEVVLDELPYGNFVEIEGPDSQVIHAVSDCLQLKWEASVPASYTMLFEQLVASKGFKFRDLSFTNFKRLKITPSDLGVEPADSR